MLLHSKKIVLSILIQLVITIAVAQTPTVYKGDTINRVDNTNLKQGKWITFDASNITIIEQGIYVNNKKEGIWQRYFPNGKVKHEITFKGGLANGPAKFYYEDGKLWESGIWIIDHWAGKYVMNFPNGSKAYEWQYDNSGKRTGVQNYYHENGKIKYTGTWDNGKTVGALKVYDEKGKLQAERMYEDGKFETTLVKSEDSTSATNKNPSQTLKQFTGTGQHTVYNMAGKIEKSGYFENGRLINGYQLIYDQDGNLSTRLFFEKGNLIRTVSEK